ncbi:MAG: hypothetical protein ACJA0H_000681 [Francisellaceae bacterium]|jgi:hypothetical protein
MILNIAVIVITQWEHLADGKRVIYVGSVFNTMIFVTVSSQLPFNRLLDLMDDWSNNNKNIR